MPSMPCHECRKVKRCRMHLDERDNNKPIYLCEPCARALGYAEPSAKEA